MSRLRWLVVRCDGTAWFTARTGFCRAPVQDLRCPTTPNADRRGQAKSASREKFTDGHIGALETLFSATHSTSVLLYSVVVVDRFLVLGVVVIRFSKY